MMIQVLQNSCTMILTSSGFACDHLGYNPINQNIRIKGCFSVSFRAGNCTKNPKFENFRVRVCKNLRDGSKFLEVYPFVQVGLLNGCLKRGNLSGVNVMVDSIQCGFVSEEGKEESLMNESVSGKGYRVKLYYLEERDEEALSRRVLSLSRTNKMRSALELFMSMVFSGLQPSLHACNSLLSCLSRNSMLDDAFRVFTYMKKNDIVSGHSLSLVAKTLANLRGYDECLRVFSEWQRQDQLKQHLDSVVYNTMISVCAKENDWVQMEKIWNAMKENAQIGTSVTYRVLVCTFVRCGQYELGLDAYSEMLCNRLTPGEDTMQAIVCACMKERKWDLALDVFENMLKEEMNPNSITCNALINSLGKAGKVKEAFRVYNYMRSMGYSPDAYTWNALLGALYNANQHANALKLFDSIMKDHQSQLNVHLYNTALMCCQAMGLWENALQLLWHMEESGITVSTASYNLVIGACEASRKPKVALRVYEHMMHQKGSPDTFTYLSLIRSCVWGDMWNEVQEILDMTPNVSVYNAVIHGMCLRGKIESAKKLYMEMRDSGLVPDGKTRALMLQYLQQ